MHEGADYEFLVETVFRLPGRGVTPHDHKTWSVVVGLDGMETNTNWHRKDDGVKPAYADLEARNDVTRTRGQTCTFMLDDNHSVHNDGDTPVRSLHVYGRSLSQTGRFEFDPAAKAVKSCATRERSKS